MENNTVLWITIAAYIICLVVIGIVEGRKAKSIADLTVGGRNAGAWLSALSYGTAYFSAVMFVGYAGKTGLSFGLWGVLAGLGNAVFGSLLAWLVLARRTREISGRLKIHTMPDFFEKRYNSRAMRIFSAVVIFVFLIPYSASVYSGLASVADVLLGIDDTIFLIIIAVLAILLVTLGGYLVQARADFVQGIVMMFGVVFLIVAIVMGFAYGNGSYDELRYMGSSANDTEILWYKGRQTGEKGSCYINLFCIACCGRRILYRFALPSLLHGRCRYAVSRLHCT